jgi:WXXGXW repeat (2 copies)
MKAFKTAIIGAALAALAPIASTTALAQVVFVTPPPPRVETVPVARVGYAWDAGHWRWAGHGYAWTPGHWRPVRAGFHWSSGRWVQRGPNWRWIEGHWG